MKLPGEACICPCEGGLVQGTCRALHVAHDDAVAGWCPHRAEGRHPAPCARHAAQACAASTCFNARVVGSCRRPAGMPARIRCPTDGAPVLLQWRMDTSCCRPVAPSQIFSVSSREVETTRREPACRMGLVSKPTCHMPTSWTCPSGRALEPGADLSADKQDAVQANLGWHVE